MSELMQKIERVVQNPFFDQTGRCSTSSSHCKILKLLLNGTCSFDCAYCEICTKKNGINFTPEEAAHAFLELNREGRFGGLLLSTGIPRGDTDLGMEQITETARLIRASGFNGYLHLKVLPGAERSDITELARYATRLSINLEAADASHLAELATVKTFESDLLRRHQWLSEIMPHKHSTQFVVGAAEETDKDIFRTVMTSYEKYSPARVYYSAFQAIADTPLEHHENTPLWRANRWYQTDALLRVYGYTRRETEPLFDADGMLKNTDPKILLAQTLPPVNPTDATYEELIRVPGIGPVSATNILTMREQKDIRNPQALSSCGVIIKRALPYLSLGKTQQLRLSAFCQ
ncbi:MAG TPA: radical SAM protein [Methanocorpusculum sp.]|nr:radical SAM protein [Methanocorpusculum sp.]